MVADSLVYHPLVAHYLRFIGTTVGRDKAFRTVQFFARFYAWYLYRTNRPQSAIAPWDAVKKQFAMARRFLRLGRFIEPLKAAAIAYDNKNPVDPILRYLTVGRQLGYTGYLSLETITFFDATGIKKFAAAKRIQNHAYRAWLYGLICSSIAGFYTLWRLRQKEQTLDRKEGEGVVEAKKITKEREAARLQLIADLCDLTVPVTSLGYAQLDDGIIGIAGTISSLIGVWSTWKKTA